MFPDMLDMFVDVEGVIVAEEVTLLLFNEFPEFVPFMLEVFQSIGQTRALQIRQEAGDDGVDRTEHGDGGMIVSAGRTQGGQCCRDDELQAQTGVDGDRE